METLRISPKYTSDNWTALDRTDAAHWPKAVAIVRDRLHGRFLHFADKCLKDEFSGFVVLSIDCLLVETIQQFIEDSNADGHGRKKSSAALQGVSERITISTRLLTLIKVRGDYYRRYPLWPSPPSRGKEQVAHPPQAGDAAARQVGTDGYIIDVERFHTAIRDSLEDYLTLLSKPERSDLRRKLWTKMDHICNVRIARGALYGADSSAADPSA